MIRAKRTSEHMALALFMGILLYFAHSFIVTKTLIPDDILRRMVSAVFAVLRLGAPAFMFGSMQKRAGFEELEIKKNTEGSAKYNATLAFGGFAVIFIFGILYSAAFPMAAMPFESKNAFGVIIDLISMVLIPALLEEFLYRRLVCLELTIHGTSFAIIISSLLFGLAHFSFYTFPYAFFCGIILGYVYIKTGSVKYTVAIHFANNFLSYILSLAGANMDKLNHTNLVMLLIIAMGVMALGAFYTVIPNMKKFALCENGNISSSLFLTFSMVVYIACAVLMNFI